MRIVVVEDEYRVRSGVVKLIGKIKPEYEVVAEAENGLAGVDTILENKPDLVIVDIKMPLMDGIEMLSKLKEKGIKHKTIILSGYSDFEFAQKAIKLGVSEYLLKPVTANDLEQTLLNIEKEILMEKMLEANQTQVLSSIENIFQNIVMGGSDKVEEMYRFLSDRYGLGQNTEFAAVSVYYGTDDRDHINKLKIILADDLTGFGSGSFTIFDLALHQEIIVLIYNSENLQAYERFFQNRAIRDILGQDFKGLAFGWIQFTGPENIKNSINTIRKELKWSIVLGEDILISYPKTRQINTKLIHYPIELESASKACVFSNDPGRLNRLFEEFASWWRKELYHPAGVIEAFVRFASSIINVIKETDYDLYEAINQKETLQKLIDSITWNELHSALFSIIEKITAGSNREIQAVSLIVKKAVSLVNEFYKDGITLDQTAARLNITPEYLGSLFNREMGINFSTYIKEFRIKKAKGLLIGKDLKTYEISRQVGYSDPKYFCRVFKETTGLTPGEYQKAYK
ncbi:response regulator transcription factor [Ruminiclostridium cellobioparum]|uniref:Stage 0 sporulation protein A homolog n=1 Tax=Ruminiclostridium cellobioparum subsp. termitidis CT1112 TaxID=1195236 RepID=S0FLU8_RUMCE|nr:response regulator [Ruminiclostridium cellobioparum]EMS69453.1 two component transcriptional regulator, AraC family protein [Ruminiclostridium cellobioparum subsp. termitidis CT1112]